MGAAAGRPIAVNVVGTPGVMVGARCLWRGLRLITSPGLRAWAVLPALIAGLLFALVVVTAGNELLELLTPAAGEDVVWLRWLLWIALAATGLLAFGFLFALLSGLLAAPFLGYLTAAVERRFNPDTPTAPASFWWQDLRSGFAGEWRKLKYLLLILCLPALLLLVPGANLLAPLVWFIAGAWLMAVEFLDYPCAYRGHAFPAALALLRAHRRLAFGFGGAIALLSAVPVLNCLVLPAAVAGASVLYREMHRTHEA